MFYTYILQSEKNLQYYIGYTGNIERRLELHNIGLSRHTSKYLPYRLVWFQSFETKKEAILMEANIKSMKNTKRFLSKFNSKLNI